MFVDAEDTNGSSSAMRQPAPYAASWVDDLSTWVEQLPGKSWVYYLAFGLILLALQLIVLWMEGAQSVGIFLPVHAFLAGVIPFFLGLFSYLDARASTALATMQPALDATEEQLRELRFRLITLPRRPAFLAGLLLVLLALLSEAIGGAFYKEELVEFPISSNLFRVFYFATWWLLGTYLYHSLHQLRMIDTIYTNHTHINLFRAKPFYAFSVLSAITAGSMGMILYGWLLVNPTVQLTDPTVLFWVLIILASALFIFLWPQLGMYRLQVVEKERLLNEAYLRLEATIAELHRQVDSKEYEAIGRLSPAISSLQSEVSALKGIRTWPWEPETFRVLVTALVMPLGLWLIQSVLERILGS